jgi:hypothetical protein
MDFEKALLKEHSKANMSRIVDYVGNSQRRFSKLLHVFLKGPYRVTQRAAWPLAYCVENHPRLVTGKVAVLIKQLHRTDTHDAVKRNLLRLLQFVEIPVRLHGNTTAICFQLLEDRREPVAVRVFAMAVLGKLAFKYPALQQELKLILEDNLPMAKPAFYSRARKVLHQFKQ